MRHRQPLCLSEPADVSEADPWEEIQQAEGMSDVKLGVHQVLAIAVDIGDQAHRERRCRSTQCKSNGHEPVRKVDSQIAVEIPVSYRPAIQRSQGPQLDKLGVHQRDRAVAADLRSLLEISRSGHLFAQEITDQAGIFDGQGPVAVHVAGEVPLNRRGRAGGPGQISRYPNQKDEGVRRCDA
jgi:hypothetical protein